MIRVLLAALALGLAGSGAAQAQPVPIVTPATDGVPWSASDVATVRAKLAAAIAAVPLAQSAHLGVLAVSTADGTPLYARNAGAAFQPASTYKVLTAAAALRTLGPQFRFQTTLDATSAPHAGRIAGNLVLHGDGDPTLRVSDLDAAAAALAAAGIHEVGGIAVDEQAFRPTWYPEGWTWDDLVYAYAAPATALSVDENAVRLWVGPGPRVGTPLRVTYEPGVPHVPVDVTGVTAPAGSPPTLALDERERHEIRVVGSVPAGGAAVALHAAVPDPVAFAAAAFADALRRRGITVDRPGVAAAGTSGGPALWTRESAPLGQLLGPFLLPSDNFYGEMLLFAMGAARSGGPGGIDDGLAVLGDELAVAHIDPGTVSLADGCGVSQYDRLTPGALVALFQDAWNSGNRLLWLDALPIWGVRGTISDWPSASHVQGRVFAKDGWLMHARGLAGYLQTAHHGAVTFAFLLDDYVGSQDEPVQSLFADLLAALAEA